ncbi:hypothetical protein OPQ81_006267 [Rhizoctonia solani]|nr:hypothetical protein OPQ81_006267 [Rhizoctonia solani]
MAQPLPSTAMQSTDEPMTVLGFILSDKQLDRAARRSGLYFAKEAPGAAGFSMAQEIYSRFEPLGPVQLQFVVINDYEGMVLVVGYPNQEPEQLPSKLLQWGVRTFGSQPRRLTRVGIDEWSCPTVDGERVDTIMMVQDEPDSANWSEYYWPSHPPLGFRNGTFEASYSLGGYRQQVVAIANS